MEEMTFMGAQWGRFKTDSGEFRDYASIFVLQEFTAENEDFHHVGVKTNKHKILNPSLVEGLEPFDSILVYFNSKQVVVKIDKVPAKQEKKAG